MKKKYYFLILAMFINIYSYSQYEVTIAGNDFEYTKIDGDKILFKHNGNTIETEKIGADSIIEANGFTINISEKGKKIKVSHKSLKNKSLNFEFCSNSKKFIVEGSSNPCKEKKSETSVKSGPFPFPIFLYNYSSNPPTNKHKQFLIVDGNSNPSSNNGVTLYKKSNNKTKQIKKIKGGRYLSIYLQNINLNNYKTISIDNESYDFEYQKGIKSLYTLIKNENDSVIADNTEQAVIVSNHSETNEISEELKTVLISFKKIDSIQLNDWQNFSNYKKVLLNYIQSNDFTLSGDDIKKLDTIISYMPNTIQLSIIPNQVKDKDKTSLTFNFIDHNNYKSSSTYALYSKNGASFNIGSTFYITGLIDDDIYEVEKDSMKFVGIDKTQKYKMGIGITAEMSLRNAMNPFFHENSFIRPILNVGFFIPLDENVSPILAIGSGFNLGNETFVFSLSGGPAIGNVERLRNKYKEVDISTISATEELTKSVTRVSWQFGLGLSYNFGK